MPGIKVTKLDRLFSLYIRTRDNWTCQSCLKVYPPGSRGLHNSHFWSRRAASTRFDPDNCCALCFSCHQRMDGNPAEHVDWKKAQIGHLRYESLRLRNQTIVKTSPVWREEKLSEIQALLKAQGVNQPSEKGRA